MNKHKLLLADQKVKPDLSVLDKYKGPYFGILNKTLRNGDKLEKPLAILSNKLSKYIHKQTWKYDFKLYRSIDSTYAKTIRNLNVGDIFFVCI